MNSGNPQGMTPTRSGRFVSDIIADLQAANDNPIDGYQHLDVNNLEKAVETLADVVPGLANYIARARDNCNMNQTDLTREESAAIYLYTMQTPFYSRLNETLRANNRDALQPWFAFLKLFMTALGRLKSREALIWRGVAKDVGPTFVANTVHTWWSVNSCSEGTNVVEFYLGETGTIFAISAKKGKDISDYSAMADEREVLLMCGTRLHVKSDPLNFQKRLSIVHLEER